MGRLEEKMAQVAGIAERVTKSLEERADHAIARETFITGCSDRYFKAKNAILDEAQTALNNAERALAIISNGGGDPLPVSSTSPIIGGEQFEDPTAKMPSVPEVAPITPPFQPT
jgi:hypothetical protein